MRSEADESMKTSAEEAGFFVSHALSLVLSFGLEVKVTEILYFNDNSSVLTVT